MPLYSELRPDDPSKLGRFALLGRLGEGGMGVVYLGWDDGLRQEPPDDDELVAIKTVKGLTTDSSRKLRQFHRELEAAQRVPRFCTAQVHDYDLGNDPPFIVTEYIRGLTLAREVEANGPLSASKLHGVAVAVAAALRGIHAAGVVHGDLTPANVLLSPFGPRVIDFGIARVLEQTAEFTSSIVGTPAFMAPERFRGVPVSRPADVFAWGCVIAFAGTGRRPFGHGADRSAGTADLDGLDPLVRRLVEAALQEDPDDRPDAGWLQDELMRSAHAVYAGPRRTVEVDWVMERAREGSELPPPPARPSASAPEDAGFSPMLLGALLAGLAAVLLLAGWLGRGGELGSLALRSGRSAVGYGVFLLPVLFGWWAGILLAGRGTVRLWPGGRIALQDVAWERGWRLVGAVARLVGHAAWTTLRSPAAGGPLLLFAGGLGLIHLVRSAPPLWQGSVTEWRESGGIIGALLVRWAVWLQVEWLAYALMAALVVVGGVRFALPVRRRWGTGPFLAVTLVGAAVVTAPAFALGATSYRYWLKVDGASDQLAVVRGLDVRRAEVVERFELTEDSWPEVLRGQLRRGLPVGGSREAEELARSMPFAFDRQEPTGPVLVRRGAELTAGMCLRDMDPDGAAVASCSTPHGAQVYGVVALPYRSFPDTEKHSALREFSEGACTARFDGYVGIAFDRSELDVDTIVPTAADWAAGARSAACLLLPEPARQLEESLRGSRRIFADDFSTAGVWGPDPDNKGRCVVRYGGNEQLSITKQQQGTLDRREAGLLCVATPVQDRLVEEQVRDVRLTAVASAELQAPNTNRVGFVCREDQWSRYHLTVAFDGTWRIEKLIDEPTQARRIAELGSGTFPGVVPATGSVELQATCRGGEDGTRVKLALLARSAAGRLTRIGDAEDVGHGPPLRSGTVGVAVVAADPTLYTAEFDDVVVSAL